MYFLSSSHFPFSLLYGKSRIILQKLQTSCINLSETFASSLDYCELCVMNPIVNYIKQTLQGYYPDAETVSMAKWLLTEVFGMSALQLYAGDDTSFSPDEQKQLDDILARLQKYEPLQYIIGIEHFFGLTFEVNPSVLIPRPETAELVEWIINEGREGMKVLDIGTGSGCIAISLAKHLRNADVTAWDISTEALQVASRNAERNDVRVNFQQRDVLQVKPEAEKFDVIVSNPPYIAEREKTEMEANVLEWEPEQALFVPDDDPLRFYRRIAELGKDILTQHGLLYFEINRAYGRETVRVLEALGYRNIELRKDMAHNDRMIKAER